MRHNFDACPGGVMGYISNDCIEPVGPVYDGKHASIPSIKTTPVNRETNDSRMAPIKTKWDTLTQAFLDQPLNGGGITGFLGF